MPLLFLHFQSSKKKKERKRNSLPKTSKCLGAVDSSKDLFVKGTHTAAAAATAAAKSLQSCPTLCDTIDSSPPGPAVPGILQAITLEWVAISFSNA